MHVELLLHDLVVFMYKSNYSNNKQRSSYTCGTIATSSLFFFNRASVLYLECMLREEPLCAFDEAHGAV